ncbi:putative Zn finger protein [Actinoalloteichus hoggarensis]|uniref:Uncharacterized protein n=1 Tax=Actinoalloteichus hoggarensis TaxID=1470176 RepID=A0A221W4E8_9PSEU|nr:hypothetical protein [Actinoalloteichus hoggarensis]ASO20526.1 hypothetical protein AHOG_14420 [Actinoalloteichus hoggarensis]MBB5923566.1 putative Zn finger protein [Actinoalloteichus hoggarensis]
MNRAPAEPALGFPPFPPGRARRPRTWWGAAWTRAVRDTSLDDDQLRRGRRHAAAGHVESITVSPGRLAARVHDADGSTHHSVVRLEPLADHDWDRLLDQITRTAGHVAALADHDMPPELAEIAADAGIRLFPGLGDLDPDCDCAGFEHPCRHAAALCCQAGWLVDDDPFVLLLLRGRDRDTLLDELQAHTAAAPTAHDESDTPPPESPGVPAAQAYTRHVAPLPPPPPPVTDHPPAAVFDPGPGVDPTALAFLVTDAARRAADLLILDAPPPPLNRHTDGVRIAATHDDPSTRGRLAAAAADPAAFPRAVRAWELGGRPGLEALETVWHPTAEQTARAHDALTAYREQEGTDRIPELRVWRNRWTADDRGVQLRLGRDGRWYPFRRDGDSWHPAGPPGDDPTAVLTELTDRGRPPAAPDGAESGREPAAGAAAP